jgi:outer membrane protein assembly factor BamB
MEGVKGPYFHCPILDNEKVYFTIEASGRQDPGPSYIMELDLSNLEVKPILVIEGCAEISLIEDNKLFAASIGGMLRCIDKNNHNIIWEFKLETMNKFRANMSTEIGKFEDNILLSDLHGSGEKFIYCVDENSQKIKWHLNCKVIHTAANFITEGNKFYFTQNGSPGFKKDNLGVYGVYCMDLNTQKILWSWEKPDAFYGYKMELFSDNHLVTSSSEALIMLDKATGKHLCEIPCSDNASMKVVGKQIFFTEENLGLACYEYTKDSGFIKKWNYKNENTVLGGFHIFDGKIIVGVGDKAADDKKEKNTRLQVLDAETGAELTVKKTKKLTTYFIHRKTNLFLFNSDGQIELMSIS